MSGDNPRPSAPSIIPGWQARYVGGEPRLSGVADMYRELGFEVRIEPMTAAAVGECGYCFEVQTQPLMAVYVKLGS